MKMYIAAPEANTLKILDEILLSYYDIQLSNLPFRKKTWEVLNDSTKKGYSSRAGKSKTRISK